MGEHCRRALAGLLASYVPIALDAGGSTEATIGVVVAIANGAAIVGGYLAMRVDGSQVASATAWWSTITLISTAIVGYDLHASFIAIALTGGGMAIGLIQVLAITAVSEAVHPELQLMRSRSPVLLVASPCRVRRSAWLGCWSSPGWDRPSSW